MCYAYFSTKEKNYDIRDIITGYSFQISLKYELISFCFWFLVSFALWSAVEVEVGSVFTFGYTRSVQDTDVDNNTGLRKKHSPVFESSLFHCMKYLSKLRCFNCGDGHQYSECQVDSLQILLLSKGLLLQMALWAGTLKSVLVFY